MDPGDVAVADAVRQFRRPLGIGRLQLSATVPSVAPWSPESPRLYDLDVTLHAPDGAVVESTRLRVGFRSIRIVGHDLLVNGRRFLIRGVNRHDFDPLTGRVVTPESIREDLLVAKRFGFNAVRTSHYPDDPALLDLTDELGLFVVSEADIECHAYAHHVPHDPAYLAAFVDRVSRMVRRDKNHPSVIVWSLGNESGYGANQDAAAGWLRRYDPTRPLQYEGAIMFDWGGPQTASDLVCPMYPPIDAIVGHARSGRQRHPLIMCEYSHAMGNSNGTLAEYWQAIESTPGLQGGFIWEFRDHGILQRLDDGLPAGPGAVAELAAAGGTGVAPPGYRWAYGGDFGDTPNDGTFVTDGLLFPDRAPKPAMWEHRQLAAPIRVWPGRVWGEVVIENRQHVRDLSWLRGQWQVIADGAVRRPAVARAVPAQLPGLGPGARTAIQLPPELLTELTAAHPGGPIGEAWLTLRLISAVDEPWAAAGTPVAGAQLLLRTEGRPLTERAGVTVRPDQASGGSGRDSEAFGAGASGVAGGSSVGAPAAAVELDADGLLVHPLLAAAPRLSLWRAPTDNDRIGGMADHWKELGVAELERTLVGIDREPDAANGTGRVVVRSRYRTGGGVEVEHTQNLTPLTTGDGGAVLLVEESATIPPALTDLPRVGTVFEVVAGLDWVDWFGAGPWETYPDRRAAGEIGGYGMTVDAWFTPYLRPQESGGRHGVRWFTLSDGGPEAAGGYAGTRSVTVQLDAPRQVSLTRYRARDLDAATHHDQLRPRSEVVVHLDAAHRGVGTASCGPDTLRAYQLPPGVYRWSWLLS
jgi:beta-galactosidase